MKTIQLEWKSFNVNLDVVQDEAKSIDASCCGCSAVPDVTRDDGQLIPGRLDVHFTDDSVSDDKIQLLKDYWDSITLASPEATSYKSAAQIKSEAAAKQATDLASAVAVLKGLGLTDDQIAALRG